MAQHDYSIANQGFPATRADINNVLSAIATNNSGTSAPSTQYAGQFWIDTTSSTWTLYIHDGADDIQFATIDTSANTVNFIDSALDVVTDTSPQLGGNLDLNSNDITGTGNINNVGTITTDGLTVAGNVSVDGGTIKLDGNYPTGSNNVALGNTALDDGSLSGSNNVAVGAASLTENTSGCNNTALGYNSLFWNTTGNCNTAVGVSSLHCNQSGNRNTAVGLCSMCANTTGNDNTALGRNSLDENTTGGNNVAVGLSALFSNTTANDNTALGSLALKCNTTGDQNTAVGKNSLDANTIGRLNSALGTDALGSTTEGQCNTGIGHNAGFNVTTGNNNLLLGKEAGRAGSPSGAISTGSHNVVLGDNNITDLYCADTTISSSDKRDKTDIKDFTHGLDFVTKLNPKTYVWDKRSWYLTDDNQSILDVTPDGTHKKDRVNIGFMAQDVLALENEIGYGNSKNDMLFTSINEDQTAYGLKYERLVPVLVNAIKELKKEIDELKNK